MTKEKKLVVMRFIMLGLVSLELKQFDRNPTGDKDRLDTIADKRGACAARLLRSSSSQAASIRS
jgi:hypothetical protein